MRTPKENMYVVAPTAMLEVPLPIESFKIIDEEGNDTGEYHTVPTYLAEEGRTVTRFSSDGSKFVKGFNWTVKTIDEVREKLPGFSLTYGTDVVIMNHDEVLELLATEEWAEVQEEVVNDNGDM